MSLSTTRPVSRTPFDLTGPLPRGRVSLEASAGTGKTFTIAGLVIRYVAEGVASLDELLVVTFTRAATAELRDRVRARLAAAGRHLRAVHAGRAGAGDVDDPVIATLAGGGSVRASGTPVPAGGGPAGPVPPDELLRRAERVEAALADIDAALISTIHGFARQVLRSVGFAGDVEGAARLVEDADDLMVDTTRDLLVRLYAGEPDDTVLASAPSSDRVHKIMVEALRHPHARISPEPPAADDDAHADVDDLAHQSARVARLVGDEVQAVKDRQGIMTFDDLLFRLASTLDDPAAAQDVLQTFRRRFRIALVDEAQDTDPVQWRILETLFDDRTLVLIGDPKQAIYRFRGADVGAYVRAANRPDTSHHGLVTNHRSDASLVRAVNALFRDTTFGDPRISHVDVAARHTEDRLLGAGDGPLELRLHPVPERGDVRADTGRRAIAADLAAHVTRLLARGATLPTSDGGHRPLGAGDLAVLVRSHGTVEHVTAALDAVDVPYVVNGVGSVFEAPAADDWLVLLRALDLPSSAVRARAAAGSAFVGTTTEELAALDDDDLDRMVSDLHRWARTLRRDGVASLLRTLHADTRLGARLLGEVGGPRVLTDIEHLGELLHASGTAGQGPAAMIQWLVEQRTRVTRDEVPAEQRARRLETDANALQIMTIHGAKGLEFPVVYLPYLDFSAQRPSVPFTTTGDDPVLELGGPDCQDHRARDRDECDAENLRLAYVAFTRARHRCIAWWWRGRGYTGTPMSKLLLRRRNDPSVTGSSTSGKAAGVAQAADDLVARTDGAVSWTWMPDRPGPVAVPTEDRPVPDLDAAEFDRQLDHTWTRTSFTALATPRPVITGHPTGSAGHGDDATGPTEIEVSTGVAPRDDEPDLATVDRDPPGQAPGDGPGGRTGGARDLLLGAMTGGARVGTVVHDLYEHVDFTAPDVADAVRARLATLAGPAPSDVSDLLGVDADVLVEGILATLRTPLGPAFGDLSLARLGRSDRLDELAFELPLAGVTAAPSAADPGRAGPPGTVDPGRAVHLEGIRRAFADLPADDPMADYADRLDDPSLHRLVRGYLAGFVDLVARRWEGDVPVFHVVDYKTNVLYGRDETPTTDHYGRAALTDAMHHGHYPLQAALYTVAVHRFLRWRLPGYDPTVNLGAIGYLFVRGMVGPDTPVDADGHVTGVATWRPPVEFVIDLSERLHRGREVAA